MKSTEKDPDAAVAELNVPATLVRPVISNDVPTIGWGVTNVIVTPTGAGEQLPARLYPRSTLVIASPLTVNAIVRFCDVVPVHDPS